MSSNSDSSSSESFAQKQTILADGNTVAPVAGLRERYGRFLVRSVLGSGGFADVLLAHDPDLDRAVALKIPRVGDFIDPKGLEKFIEEARTAAKLQHPNIVQIHDVGTESGVSFIVLEYVRGRTLEQVLTEESFSLMSVVSLIESVAEALHHAHEMGFVHRDIKPANILIDFEDRPKVSDFGLAIRHRDLNAPSSEFAGTIRYMSPEQVRCESHRIDGRCDIWALGVVLYRAITKRFPFEGGSQREVLQKILYEDPVAPIRDNPGLSEELQRICLKCLSRHKAERYRTASQLAEDLRDWRLSMAGISGRSSDRRRTVAIEPLDAPLIPRGLRAFGKDDSDFFLRLIPGPRDRDGLPAVLRFWKSGIEADDAESSFRIGLLYGPSGCGKSSLIRAGLLPRISGDVRAIFVDASQQSPEVVILDSLRKQFPSLRTVERAADALREIRDNELLQSGQKFLIVIDQFEQWLQSWDFSPNAELIAALRQCDGLRSQCLILVRDDFWLPVSRFMLALETPIVEGQNAMLIDSFDSRHGINVLTEFGIAYKCLPEKTEDFTAEQKVFLQKAVDVLSVDGRLYPVRIAVFVEMFRRLPWGTESLGGLGGPDEVAMSFLNNMFGAAASQSRQSLEPLIRKLLTVLLPPTGQIKGPVVASAELRAACGLSQNSAMFDEVIRLLDSDLRIITPASHAMDDPSSVNRKGDSSSRNVEPGYQLTHDFLVPAIRRYLLENQRSSRTGRALLLLADQTNTWHARPSPRLLPSFWEWITIRFSTSPSQWNSRQKAFMAAADRRILRQSVLVVASLLVVVSLGIVSWQRSQAAERRREALLAADRVTAGPSGELDGALRDLAPHIPDIVDHLQNLVTDETTATSVRLRAAAALLPLKPELHTLLIAHLTDPLQPAYDFVPLRNALLEHAKGESEAHLRAMLADKTMSDRSRFRVLAILAGFDSAGTVFEQQAADVHRFLLRESAADARTWIEAFRPAAASLQEQFTIDFQGLTTSEDAEITALAVFELSGQKISSLASLLLTADDIRYRAIMNILLQHPDDAVQSIRQSLSRSSSPQPASDVFALKARVNAAIALWQLGHSDLITDISKHAPDPTQRTLLVESLNESRTSAAELEQLIRKSLTESPTLNVALAAFVANFADSSPDTLSSELQTVLGDLYRTHPDSETHSLCEVLFRKTGHDLKSLQRDTSDLYQPNAQRGWYLNSLDMCMVMVRREDLRKRFPQMTATLDHDFAISSTEVTREQFRMLLPEVSFESRKVISDSVLPADNIDVHHAEAFCMKLTEHERIPESEWCYSTVMTDPNDGSRAARDYLKRKGYRIPTDDEWLLATRSGTVTDFWAGRADVVNTGAFAWGLQNSKGESQPVGLLLPNPLGLLDCSGNVFETCFTRTGVEEQYNARGGSFFISLLELKSDDTLKLFPGAVGSRHGLRIVRTLP